MEVPATTPEEPISRALRRLPKHELVISLLEVPVSVRLVPNALSHRTSPKPDVTIVGVEEAFASAAQLYLADS